MDIFNEVICLIMTHFLILHLGDFVSVAIKRVEMSQTMINITIVNFAINLIPVTISVFKQIKARCIKCQLKKKEAKHQKELETKMAELANRVDRKKALEAKKKENMRQFNRIAGLVGDEEEKTEVANS